MTLLQIAIPSWPVKSLESDIDSTSISAIPPGGQKILLDPLPGPYNPEELSELRVDSRRDSSNALIPARDLLPT